MKNRRAKPGASGGASQARRVVRLGLYAVLATPLLASSWFLFPHLTPKVVGFQMLVEIVAGAAVVAWLQGRPEPAGALRRLPTLGALALCLAVASITAFFGLDPRLSFWGFLDRQDGLVLWLHFAAWAAVVAWFFRSDPRGLREYCRASFWVSAAVALASVAEWLLWRFPGAVPLPVQSIISDRPRGVVGNPGILSPGLLSHLFSGLHFPRSL